MEWTRGKMIGKGSFSSVYLAIPRTNSPETISPLMAVKSSPISDSSSLHHEKLILTEFKDCPQILDCFGHDYTEENGKRVYNLLLEFASRGNLAQLLKNSDGSIPESQVRFYANSILKGLQCIHDKGYVHCDIKLQNILLCNGDNEVKIADFGLAKKATKYKKTEENRGFRGTPMYMAPESVAGDEQEPASDIWALGCVVLEMISGIPAWKCRPYGDVSALLYRIGFGEELPEIPADLSEEGKDFLLKCLVRDPLKRWTAEMLLNHPFIANSTVKLDGNENRASLSPRSPFDFSECCSSQSCSHQSDRYNCSHLSSSSYSSSSTSTSPLDRIRQLRTRVQPNWSSNDSWLTVRKTESPVPRCNSGVCSSDDRDGLS